MKNSIIERARALAAHKVILFGLALCAMAFYALPVRAYYADVVEIDSIKYQLNDKDKTAAVGNGDETGNYFYEGHSRHVAIPSHVTHGGKTYTVTRISAGLKSHMIYELVLPATITTIDQYAFGFLCYTGDGVLKQLNIPANVESYSEDIFRLGSINKNAIAAHLDHLIIESPEVSKYYYNIWERNKADYRIKPCAGDTTDNPWWTLIFEKVTVTADAGDTIHDNTFKYWRHLKEINLPKYNTQYIGAYAFQGCTALEKTNLAELKTLKRINDYAFLNCTALTNADLPESLTNIGTGVFMGCKKLTHASLPSTYTWVPQSMYENCNDGPLQITFSENVTRICPFAFRNCKLKELILPSKIEIIEENAFQSTKVGNNKDLVLPKSLAMLGDFAFHSSDFAWLTVNAELSYLGKGLFSESELETVTINNGSILLRAEIESRSAASIFGFKVKKYTINEWSAIPNNFFKGCASIEEIDFTKAHVLSIGEGAFENCISLKSIDTDDATTLGASAFKGCTSLTDVDLIAVTAIPEYAFQNCSALKNIYLGKAQTLASNAFEGCKSIAAFSAQNTNYFNTEGGLLYNSDKTHLFLFPRASENFALDDYELPETVTSLHCDAFDYCTHLHSITSRATTPPSVVAKGSRSTLFQNGIERLIKIYVPESSIAAYKSAWGTDHCEYYALQSGTCTVDGITYQFNANQTASVINGTTPYSGNVVIPATFEYGGKTYQVTGIGDNTFDDCSDLTSISLPEGLLTIGHAFGYCTGLTSLTLPRTLTSIGWNAFRNCTNLTEIVCKAVNPPTCEMEALFTAFRNVPETTPLWVPKGSVSKYREATGWKNFKDNTYAFAATCADVNAIDGNSKAFLKPVSVAFVSGRYVYIQDETGTTMLYLNAADEAIYKGAKIAGIEGKTILYSGLPEVKPSNNVSDWTITADGDEPSMKTIIEVPTYNEINQFVRIEGASLDAEFTASKSTEVSLTMLNGNIILRNQFRLEYSFSAEKRYDILAAVAINNDVMKLYFIDVLAEHDAPSPQGVESILTSEFRSQKVLRDGKVLILKDGKTFNVLGQELR